MVNSTKTFRVKLNKRSTTELGDDTISGPKLLSTNAIPWSDLHPLERERIATLQDNQRNNAKATSSAKRRRPKLDNAKSSAGQVKIIYLPQSRDTAIGVALGSPSQEWSFEPSRSPPIPGRIQAAEALLRPSARSESVPDIRLRPGKWKSFGSFFGKRSASPAARPGQDGDVLNISGPVTAGGAPPRFPTGAFPSSTSSLPKQISEEESVPRELEKRPALARGTSSSIAAPQQVQASSKEHVDQFLPGLPGSVQAATEDLIAMSRKLQQEKEREERRGSESSDRKDSVIQTPSDDGDEPSPLPPPKDEGYLAKKPKKPVYVESPTHVESIASLDTMKEVVVFNDEEPEEVQLTESPKKIEPPRLEEIIEEGKSEHGKEDSESLLEIEAMANEEPHNQQKHSDNVEKGPWLDVIIPRIEMERYSIMFGSVLKRDTEQDLPQGLPQGLLERRQAHLDKIQAVPKTTPKTKEPNATGDVIPKSAGDPKEVSPSLFPLPLKPTKSTRRPKPSPLVRFHTSPKLRSPMTGTFLNTTPSTAAMSPRSWSDDNILLLATPASQRSYDDDDDDDAATIIEDTLPMRRRPLEPQWEMMTTPTPKSTSKPRIGLPSSVRPVKSGVYTAKRAEIGNARAVSFARTPKVVTSVASKPNLSVVKLVDTSRRNSQVGQVEDVSAS